MVGLQDYGWLATLWLACNIKVSLQLYGGFATLWLTLQHCTSSMVGLQHYGDPATLYQLYGGFATLCLTL